MASVAGIAGLSELAAWPTEHLTEAAEHWEAVAGRSYAVASQVWRDALSTDWHGEGAEALRTATHADMLTTSAAADQLQTAAKVARSGASDLYAARSRVRYAIEDANTAGFDVGEDMSVTDRSTGGSAAQRAARQAQAQTLAADIRQRAAQLVALDQQVAGKVAAAMAGIRETFPPQSRASDTPSLKPMIQTVDNHTFKQDPSPPPYPINDVIAQATDLDGNYVVLRRGYYDERTQQGFGWDKAYWRHHVVNPNVFKDLISHSRPISNDDGTLVYEVPINRVHCTQGPLGLTDCEDTGEQVTMRIVANINEGRGGIPDGGQKGVISMYPVAGGSGVVEVEPGWTLCPPWVNKNVPIN
ncbi:MULTISPECIES: hypothetical protein [unclassified Mycobacterium]|uniref:hypothetical protein n=1 Tax=unclassified Mycobacterium TaxID=2642494 RepID=UPI0007FEEDD2|nr:MULTISPECIES: hypothetical protein [unclassified Mycobacterium]OBH04889.1 hypothetical protein A5696_03000 [Mycobacterium sp. E2699]OBI53041.1 hypothetical protein A5705_03695 [Mycobacterium sp. E787]